MEGLLSTGPIPSCLVTVMTEGTVGTIETTGTVLVPVVTELTVMTQVKMCVGGNFLLVKSLT